MLIFRLSLAALFLPCATLAQDAIPAKASTCVSCHSADGNPLVDGVPILSGQREAYLISALTAYRDGGRLGGPADVMAKFAAPLSDSDIQEIAKWFATH